MGDLLSAASLLLALVAVFYGLWYPEIAKVLEIQPYAHAEDNQSYLRAVRGAIRHRAVPLLVASGSVALVFGPEAIGVVRQSIQVLRAGAYRYSAVSTAFLLVVVFSAVLCAYSFATIFRLRRLTKKLRAPEPGSRGESAE